MVSDDDVLREAELVAAKTELSAQLRRIRRAIRAAIAVAIALLVYIPAAVWGSVWLDVPNSAAVAQVATWVVAVVLDIVMFMWANIEADQLGRRIDRARRRTGPPTEYSHLSDMADDIDRLVA